MDCVTAALGEAHGKRLRKRGRVAIFRVDAYGAGAEHVWRGGENMAVGQVRVFGARSLCMCQA